MFIMRRRGAADVDSQNLCASAALREMGPHLAACLDLAARMTTAFFIARVKLKPASSVKVV